MRELKNSSQKFLVQYEMIFYDAKCKKRSPIKMCDIVVITTKPLYIHPIHSAKIEAKRFSYIRFRENGDLSRGGGNRGFSSFGKTVK